MLKFRPSNLTQKRPNVGFNELQLIALIEKGLSDNSLRGFLYKRSSPTAKWRLKWFLLFENLLFYFDLGSNYQQQQAAAQAAAAGKSSSPAKSSGFASLMKRQNKGANANRDSPDGLPGALSLAAICGRPGAPPPSPKEKSKCALGDTQEPRRASLSETLEIGRRGPSRAHLSEPQSSPLAGRPATAASGPPTRPPARKRLSSDPQNSAAGELIHLAAYEQQQAIPAGQFRAASRKTLHSSSISGVSNHFQAHNEQTIGRSTTTAAGKTAGASANYASLLNRKIGVIFLEGSYCERLIDAAVAGANFAAAASCSTGPSGGPRASLPAAVGRKNCPASQTEIAGADTSGRPEHFAPASNKSSKNEEEESELNCVFTLTWRKEGSKEYQFRTETEAECLTWVHAISGARYSTLLDDKEQLEQKYLHLSQIIESESTAKWQYSRQCDELSVEIKKLRQEICDLKRHESSSRDNHLRLVLSKSAAMVESIMRQQRHRPRQQLQPQQPQQQQSSSSSSSAHSARKPATAVPQRAITRGLGARRSTVSETPAHLATPGRESEPAPGSPQRAVREPSLAESPELVTPTSAAHLQRARSMEQEQEELELAVRRTARRRGNQQRMAAGEEQQKQRRAAMLSSLVRSAAATSCASPSALAGSRSSSPGGLYSAAGAEEEADERALCVELKSVVEALNDGSLLSGCLLEVENSEEIRKIKKVQGFFRGWLCRRRWKQIVQEYIKSPHAESMRKRNNLVFRMVECEEEYVEQLALLISSFLRPLKMAASSQKPALDHDELNSIFLNSETLLFLHQIFLKGLTARMESWPTLVLGDLFNMLLPMLTIYQEYVRNHHFSLQVLAECKQRDQFGQILRRLEEKPQLNGRTLETFLTYPMHQIPRYIICLHEILAHTPHNHVERKSLYEAQTKLEELSRQMHDEVSETENIRQNLAIERMIIGGCDILLDVNQVFVRQGILLQVAEQASKATKSRSRLASFATRNQTNSSKAAAIGQPNHGHADHQSPGAHQSTSASSVGNFSSGQAPAAHHQASESAPLASSAGPTGGQGRELVRQCFLFTNHLLLCTRTKDGKLHLLENCGRIALTEVTLIENPLEFVQQQESLAANFESAATLGQQRRPGSRSAVGARADNSSCNSISDYHSAYTQPGGTPSGFHGTDKRASTASVPARWGHQLQHAANRTRAERPVCHVEFEDPQHRDGSIFSAQFSPPAQEERPQVGHQQRGVNEVQAKQAMGTSGASSRSRIAGYLATKLSTLANLGGGSGGTSQGQQQAGNWTQQQQGSNSASAPPSPLNKRNQTSGQTPSGTCTPGAKRILAPAFVDHLGQPFSFVRDYAGCDFILLLEPTSKCASLAAGSGAAASGTGVHCGTTNTSASPIVVHLVAPNVQEKNAWMSDISQVSVGCCVALLGRICLPWLEWSARKLLSLVAV